MSTTIKGGRKEFEEFVSCIANLIPYLGHMVPAERLRDLAKACEFYLVSK